MSNLLSKIKMHPLTDDQYIRQEHDKVQIYIHHTASSPNPFGVVRDWNLTPARIGTAFVIARGELSSSTGESWTDGKIIQTFSSKYWAYHLGLSSADLKKGGTKAKTNLWLHQKSIGIEICNWGWLKETNDGYISWAKRKVPEDEILEYSTPYKGHKYYQKYTDEQLDSVRELLVYLCDKYSIPTKFKGTKMFDVCPEALQGESGIWTHTSVRSDKSDCHPQKELIEMLGNI